MGYKLEKPFTVDERAVFICEHQGLNFYEDDTCIIMYEKTESIVNSQIIDISQTSDYLDLIFQINFDRLVEDFETDLNNLCARKYKLETLGLNIDSIQDEINQRVEKFDNDCIELIGG